MGLRPRVTVMLALPIVLVLSINGYLRIKQEEAQLLAEERNSMAVTARAIQIAVENALRDRQIADVRRLLTEMVEQQEVIDRIRVFDHSLQPILVSNVLSIGEAVPEAALRRVMETGVPEGTYYHRGKVPVLAYLLPLRTARNRTDASIEIVRLAGAIERRIGDAVNDVLIRLVAVLAALIVLTAVVLQREVIRPVRRLMEGIQRLGQGQRGSPVGVERRDELGRVAEAFNEMAERLEDARARLVAETERTLELERQLQHAATLAVAGKLTSALAHEVGTPLNIISARAEFVLRSLPAEAATRRDLEAIIGQIDRISRIIRSLLDTVRPHKPDVEPTDVGALFDHLLPLLRHVARRRGVALTARVPAGLPAVLADPGQLQQVLINLVLNGLEATPAGGEVRLTAEMTERDGRAGVVLGVEDNGAGIPPELQARVFEPFFTTKAPGQGTGLGLAICRDIVHSHGGELVLESTPGAGTRFSMWLPTAGGPGA